MKHRILFCCIVYAVLCSAAYSADKPAETKPNATAAPAAAKQTDAAKKATEPAAKLSKDAATPFKDEPVAHALYKQMIDALRKAKTLSYVSRYEMGIEGKDDFKSVSTYRAWLKKPNYFRVEGESALGKLRRLVSGGGGSGILVGDGQTLWIYWPNGRFKREWEEEKDYAKSRLTSYMTKPAPPGGHSIGHEVCRLETGMSMPVIDPSTFFGYTDSLQAYVDGVKGLGSEKVDGEDCDQVEVSIMKHQRSWFLWLSKRDHLPRKMKEIVRVSFNLIITEQWSSIFIDGDIPDKMFAWKPPKDWTQYKDPPLEIGLLKPGTKAPDFDLASAEGGRIKLSDFHGKVVWFYVWRAG
jgi:outer membrane lipoprotein-sorting protein